MRNDDGMPLADLLRTMGEMTSQVDDVCGSGIDELDTVDGHLAVLAALVAQDTALADGLIPGLVEAMAAGSPAALRLGAHCRSRSRRRR